MKILKYKRLHSAGVLTETAIQNRKLTPHCLPTFSVIHRSACLPYGKKVSHLKNWEDYKLEKCSSCKSIEQGLCKQAKISINQLATRKNHTKDKTSTKLKTLTINNASIRNICRNSSITKVCSAWRQGIQYNVYSKDNNTCAGSQKRHRTSSMAISKSSTCNVIIVTRCEHASMILLPVKTKQRLEPS